MRTTRRGAIAALAIAAGTALTLAGCSSSNTLGGSSGSSSGKSIVIGSAAFDENKALGEVYGQALAAKGWKVTYKLGIGQRAAYIPALKSGEVNLIPEYAGSILNFLDKNATGKSSSDVKSQLASALPDGLTALDFSEAADADSLNVTKEFSSKNSVTSIADLSKVSSVKLAANPEFQTRPDGIPGLQSVYGLNNISFTGINDSGGPQTLKALLAGDQDVVDIYSTTPSIGENKLVTLKDPKNLFASQQVVPIVTTKKATSDLKSALNAVSAKLTTEDLQQFNKRMQGDEKADPKTVATDWLKKNGFTK